MIGNEHIKSFYHHFPQLFGNPIGKKMFTNQCSQREIVKKVCKDLPHISIAIPVNYHQEGKKRKKIKKIKAISWICKSSKNK